MADILPVRRKTCIRTIMYVHVLIIIMLFALDNFAAIVMTVNMCYPPYFYWGHLTTVTFDPEFRWSTQTQMMFR